MVMHVELCILSYRPVDYIVGPRNTSVNAVSHQYVTSIAFKSTLLSNSQYSISSFRLSSTVTLTGIMPLKMFWDRWGQYTRFIFVQTLTLTIIVELRQREVFPILVSRHFQCYLAAISRPLKFEFIKIFLWIFLVRQDIIIKWNRIMK